MSHQPHCSTCGSHPSSDRPAFTFSATRSLGANGPGLRWNCAPCSREHLHAIETGLLGRL